MGQLSWASLHPHTQFTDPTATPLPSTCPNHSFKLPKEVDWEMGGQVNSQSHDPVLLQGAKIKATCIGLGKQLHQPFTWVWHSAGYRGVTTPVPFVFQQGPCYKETEAPEVPCHKSHRRQEAETEAGI